MPAHLAGRAVDLGAFAPNRAQKRAIATNRGRIGTAADLLMTIDQRSAMVFLGVTFGGAVKLTPDEARSAADSLAQLADAQDAALRRSIEEGGLP